jgi:hypothetical protein
LLFAAVLGLLATVSQHEPVVLVLDDLQWADEGSLLLLRHLAAAEQALRVLILGIYRDSELTQRSHQLVETLAALHRQHGVFHLELDGLDSGGVVALMEATAGYPLDDPGLDLAHAVYLETDGNPFFVSEILRHLSETGAIYVDSTGAWVTESMLERTALPDSVRVVIGARVMRLGLRAERVLSMAAVIGRDFDLDLLAQATTSTEDELLDILDAATAASLVRELADTPGHYSFAHALIQHTLYEDLGLTRRARAHRQIAEALEDLCGDRPGPRVGELARHWFSATQPIDLVKAIRYSRQAGDAALEALAPADALRYYAQALDLCAQAGDPDPLLGLDLAIGLGTAQCQTGRPAFRDTLLAASRRAASLGDTDRLVAAALANDRGWLSADGVIDTDRVDILETALTRLPEDCSDRALVLATLCSELTYGSPLERRHSLADEAVAIAGSCGDDAIVVRVLNHIYLPLNVPPLLEQSLARTAEAMMRAERVGDPLLILFAADWRAHAAVRAGDLEEFDRCMEIHGSLAERLGQPTARWAHASRRAMRAMIAGNPDEAEHLATEALRIGTDGGEPDAAVMFGAQLMIVSLQRGTVGKLVPLIEQAAANMSDIAPGSITATLAMAHSEADRTSDARRLLGEFSAAGFELPLDLLWLNGMVCYAEAAIECRDSQFAGPLFDRLAPWADQLSTAGPTVDGPVSHYVGGLAAVLGRYEEADAYLAQSASMSDRLGAKFFGARTDLLWGRMFAERRAPGDTERARNRLTKARVTSVAHGYGNVGRRATNALHILDT